MSQLVQAIRLMLARSVQAIATALGALLLHGAALAQAFEGVVVRVNDGDSISVRPADGGRTRTVRLRGIDAPEICQAFGPESRSALAARLLHQSVSVDTQDTDTYGRILAVVRLRGEDTGQWMVREGYAWSYRYQRDPGPYAAEQSRARSGRAGLWADPDPQEPRRFRRAHGDCHARR